MIAVSSPEGSLGSGGIRTKWRISAADVPMYKLLSKIAKY